MNDEKKTKKQMIKELVEMRRKITELEALGKECNRSEEEIKTLVQQKEFILDVTKTGMNVIDPEFNVRYIDPEWVKVYGDPKGKKCYEYFRGRNAYCTICEVVEALKTKKLTVRDKILPKENNRPVQVTTIPFQNVKGEWLVASVIVDITERRRAEEALRVSEKKYRALVENINDVIFSLDTQGFFTYISPAIERFARYTVDDVIGQPFFHFVHPDDLPDLQASFERTLNGSLEPHEFRVLAKDGTIHHVRTSSRPLFKNGQRAGLTGVMTNITERKQIEEALRENEKRYKSLYRLVRLMCDNVPDMIWAKDLGKRFIFANKAICEKLLNARDTDEPLGQTDMYFAERERTSHPDHPEWHSFGEICKNSDSVVMESKKAERFDEFGNVKGEFLFLDVYKAPFWGESGEMIGTVGCGRDVTKEKEMEEYRKRAEERLSKINKCFLSFSTDPFENINRLTALCGEVMEATCALYNRLDGDMIYSVGKWNTPPDFNSVDKAEGHICYDVIQHCGEDVYVVRDLQHTKYAETDPNVSLYKLQTYIGKAIKWQDRYVGSLCVVYQKDILLNEADIKVMEIIASAISIEEERGRAQEVLHQAHDELEIRVQERTAELVQTNEALLAEINERKRAEEALRESEHKLSTILQGSPIPAFVIGKDHKVMYWSKTLEELSGIRAEEIIDTNQHWKAFYSEKRPCLADLLVDEGIDAIPQWYEGKFTKSKLIDGAYEATDFFPALGEGGKWLHFTAAIIRNSMGNLIGVLETLEDITELKRAEETLLQSEQRKTILNQIATIFLTIPDEEMFGEVLSIVLRVMKSKYGILGYIGDNGELIMPSLTREVWGECKVPGKSIVFPSDTWGESLWGRAIREKKAFYSDGPFHTPEGHVHIDHFLTVPIVFGKETIGLLSVANKEGGYTEVDKELQESIANFISPILNARLQRDRQERERKQAEEALRESENRYRLLAENATDTIWTTDMNLRLNYISPSVKNILGYSVEEAMAQTIEELLMPASLEVARKALTEELALENMGQKDLTGLRILELEVKCKNGSTVWTESTITFLRDFDRGPIGILGVTRDITERKRADEALRESEERYRSLFDGVPVGLYRTTPAGNILDANLAFINMLSYPNREALLASNIIKDIYVTPEVRIQWQAAIEREGIVRDFDAQYHRRDGTIIWTRDNGRCVRDEQGRLIWYEGTLEDITERKWIEQERASLEEQLRQSQKMEAIGRLAGGVAHDFNNLLTVIKGYCDLVLMGLKEDGPLKRAIEEINKAGERAATLTHQLLAFSRRQILELKVVNLNDILGNLNKMLQRLIGEDIELVTILGESLSKVKVDPGQMEQVVMNLAVNARDAMEMGGKLILETANVEVEEDTRNHLGLKVGSYVMLSVRDTGIGIPPEVKEHIFEPFYTTKEKGKGSGLGLSMVYGIVKQSGGYIEVESEPGLGATFKIYLPRLEGIPKGLDKRLEHKEIPRGRETILIVEDDEAVRNLAKQVLETLGYQVLEASSGEESLRLYKGMKGPIHLVLTDVVMPRMSGRELAEYLLSSYPEIKILYMSGYTDDAIVHHGVLKEGAHYIQKPFPMEGLAKKVREVLDNPPQK